MQNMCMCTVDCFLVVPKSAAFNTYLVSLASFYSDQCVQCIFKMILPRQRIYAVVYSCCNLKIRLTLFFFLFLLV
jgi:hypothetical protein